MIRPLALAALVALSACAGSPEREMARRAPSEGELPPMKIFGEARVHAPTRSNRSIAQDILDLTFELESGRALPVLTRFEGPITVRLQGRVPSTLIRDTDLLIARMRREARIDIRRVMGDKPAGIVIEVVPQARLMRAVPDAACFVVPRMTSWDDFRRNRRSPLLDWTTLRTREHMAVFLPGGVSPQEARDCLHEELAQAIGPLNDLYRLSDSVFNDDNFHTVLTGFDMLVLRTLYDPALRSGMTRDEVAARLPAILNRINPRGRSGHDGPGGATPVSWKRAIETALGPRTQGPGRRAAAREAVTISRDLGWTDGRAGFSLYALGRLSIASDPDTAMRSFIQSGRVFTGRPDMELQAAHVAMQLAAFALSAGEADLAAEIVDRNLPPVAEAENAALLATLLLVKAEALEDMSLFAEARRTRRDALGWARYGFGSDEEVRARMEEIGTLSPRQVAAR